MAYEHLRMGRETPLTERHPRKPGPHFKPDDPRAFGANLGGLLQSARARISEPDEADVGGFDERKLLKIILHADETLPNLEAISGVEVVSQEAKEIVLAFASEAALDEVEARLTTLAQQGSVKRKELLYALENFDHWTPADRTGAALRQQGFPAQRPFVLDVELWPQDRQDRRDAMLDAFLNWLREQHIESLDSIKQPSLMMVRLRCDQNQAEQLLRHRDVRTVDLPPRLGVSVELLHTDINQFPAIDPPADEAPAVAVLDSGLTRGHPLLAAAVGDAQGYLAPNRSPDDDPSHWHGTFVGALAMYGDVHACIQSGQFVPQLRLFSGKVFNDDGQDQTEFVEKAVEAAVRDLHEQYGCRVFNLSYGDLNKIYDGRHVRGLAYTLDRLTRELGVLFVVPTGNLTTADLPANARDEYPNYLTADGSRLLDPATALNALTVGGLTLNEATRDAQRYPNGIEDHPIARVGQPFPLTRGGPSINGAIKPDVVEYAGNVALMRAGGRTRHAGLGVVSLNGGFANGPAFREDIGTSYAAPMVAHKAARLLAEVPTATPNLLRALLGAHARWPQASEALLNPNGNGEGRDQLLRLVGYGRVDDAALFRSLDHTVTLLAEEQMGNDQHHFFELPLPESFWAGGRRTREITVALAYSPAVRTTRLDYRMSKLWFTVVTASSLDTVTEAFRRNRAKGMGERNNGRWLPNDTRKNGTLQVSRWSFKQALANGDKVFAVVTRQDSPWSNGRDSEEPYALAAVLADREQVNVNLYAEVRAALEARVQARARARV
ncbi:MULTISPECIES: S8 family peptidase [Burkholderia]|uniref:S8 family peptidase n=1 Tax=Burkholderia TaxID=32008 RepID=UPI000F522F7C|nr:MULTISPECIES: S8 family peptidase [Burkholderia]RQM51979.1 S8 family peptidase [Burkholderia vietnamiensis]